MWIHFDQRFSPEEVNDIGWSTDKVADNVEQDIIDGVKAQLEREGYLKPKMESGLHSGVHGEIDFYVISQESYSDIRYILEKIDSFLEDEEQKKVCHSILDILRFNK